MVTMGTMNLRMLTKVVQELAAMVATMVGARVRRGLVLHKEATAVLAAVRGLVVEADTATTPRTVGVALMDLFTSGGKKGTP